MQWVIAGWQVSIKRREPVLVNQAWQAERVQRKLELERQLRRERLKWERRHLLETPPVW